MSLIELNQLSTPVPFTEILVCRLEDLPLGLGRAFSIAGRNIAIFRTRKEKLFALDNSCPHKGGPLADGMLAGDQVVCPLHAFRFDGTSGACDQAGICAVNTYSITQKEGVIFIRLPIGSQEGMPS
jgi:nitrite reductase (NADH) small subunit